VYELRLSRLESGTRESSPERDGAGLHEIRRKLVAAQHRALAEIRAERATPAEVLGRIQHDIDLEETRLR
jgi:hypothetical protein